MTWATSATGAGVINSGSTASRASVSLVTKGLYFCRMPVSSLPVVRWTRAIAVGAVVSTAVGIVFALPHLADVATRRQYVLSFLAEWWSWGLLTPVIVACDSRFPLPQRGVKGWLLPRILLGLIV